MFITEKLWICAFFVYLQKNRNMKLKNVTIFVGVLILLDQILKIWIKTNLAYKIQRYSQQYEYDYAGIEKESYCIKEWNGSNWISKPLHTGDKFSIVEGNTITDHAIITNQYGKTDILTSLKYTYNNETKKTTIDAGWY